MSPNDAEPEQANAGPGQAAAAPERTAADSRPGDLRQVSDARTMRALAHPVRIALLEMLSLEGAMTATEIGERISESPTTCSFHLRQLAKYGFVEEAGGGKGRARRSVTASWTGTGRGGRARRVTRGSGRKPPTTASSCSS